MNDLNSVTLVCRLGKDPELRTLGNGNAVTTLRVAYTQSRKNGESWEEVPGWIDVTVFGGQAEQCNKFLSKGRQVVVTGRLDYREWVGEDGTRNNRTQIVASQVQFIGGQDEKSEPARTKTSNDPPPF